MTLAINEVYTVVGYMKKPSYPLIYFVYRDIIGRLIAEILTSICYFKLYKLLESNHDIFSFSRGALKRLCFYSTIPIIWYFPTVIYYDICKKEQTPFLNGILSVIIMVLRYFWEFCNLWAYWNFKPSNEEHESELDEDLLQNTFNKNHVL